MATTPTRHRFNRAMALAIAAGVTFTGGVQIAHETNVAQAETLRADDPQYKERSVVYVGVGSHVDSRVGSSGERLVIATKTDGEISTFYDYDKSDTDPYLTPIPQEALRAAGLNETSPITISVKNAEKYDAHAEVLMQDGTQRQAAGEFYLNDIAQLLYFRPNDGPTVQGELMSLLQEDKEVVVNFMKAKIAFKKPTVTTPKVGETITIDAPEVAYSHANAAHEDLLQTKYYLVNPVAGASLDANGVLTYTPPREAAGKTVEIEVAGEVVGAGSPSVFGTQSNGKNAGASIIYSFNIPAPAASITNNGDGTFTFNDGTAGAKDITINTKDGVQDVTKQGNTLIFTMADGSTKKVDVAANVTLKQNTNGTATISDGTTTLTVATANTYIDKVEKNAKGDYILTRNDNQTFIINLQDLRNDIAALKAKDSPSRAEHDAVKNSVDALRNQLNEFTGQNSNSLEELANQISALDNKIDTSAKEFTRELTGIDTALQELETRVERTEHRLIKEVRNNGNGTFTLVTEKDGGIPGVIDTSAGVTDIISNPDGTITLEFAGKAPRTINLNQVEVTETGKGTPKHTITIKVPGEKPFRFNAFDTYVSRIDTNGKGKYTLALNNGEIVAGTIDTSKTITAIENRPDGSIVLVRTDGTKSQPIALEQVTITEANKGTPQHSITIAVPGGETVTLDAYDNFVTSVTKTSDGIYTIARNDGQTWTINIADLYKRVAGLEAKDAPTRDEFNAVNNDIAEYKMLVDTRFTAVEGDVDALRADLATLEKRATALEARVDRVDGVLGDLAKCNSAKQISGISTAVSIALYALSQVQLPGVADINTQIQQQIGIYNANAAAMWGRYGGVLQAAAVTTMAAGLLGSLAYALNACQPYNRTNEMKHTPAGEMTANIDARKVAREARNAS